ncbi:hypothetical protein G7Z17_g11525 [Cylindrodendrum hubeiense]|uniref:Uncharacterized protein n=1 Tax=Cylindrodendrum hubeiense TaxID=595255 RepID=A0A9P5GXC1_9HYPO|nr:hypothetical protein G7Z17_g11525 [Cylindrodendrum hubeiense]
MAKCWLFIVCAVTVVGVNADDLSDFSNNLASDIGPLLVLFGESMTGQYLGESTSFLDYFIFAMAPIGILTAVVSTIRVCGHSSLRGFIGRSQEGDGPIEAELCTSTSRDVCELFNRGGITRVLGQPKILELVYTQRYGGLEKQNIDTGWGRVEGSMFERWSDEVTVGAKLFAPNPNLSLNVGIVKRSRAVFFAIAAAGFILQAGVLALAGVDVWLVSTNISLLDICAHELFTALMVSLAGLLTIDKTTIVESAELGYELYVKPLIYQGASLDLSEKGSRTPLFWTAQNGHANIAKLLLNTGNVDANRPDVNGGTPLSWAAGNGHEAVVRLLLEKGADTEAKDKYGHTPLWWADKNGHEAVVKLLE